MAIDFPDTPTVSDEFTVGAKTWTWDGTAWRLNPSTPGGGGSLVEVQEPFKWPTQLGYPVTTSVAAGTTDASGEKFGFVFEIPKTGTIDRVGLGVRTVVTGGSVDFRLETVSSGVASGTLIATGANRVQTVATSDSNTYVEAILNTPVAVTKGTVVAFVVVVGSPGNMAWVRNDGGPRTYNSANLYVLAPPSGSRATGMPSMALRYTDTSYAAPVLNQMMTAENRLTVGSATSPDETGAFFQVPMDCMLQGACFYTNALNSGDDMDLILYDAADTVLESKSLLADNMISVYDNFVLFDTPVALTTLTDYRLVLRFTGANLYWYVSPYIVGTPDALKPGGGDYLYTSRTDAGAWTNDATQFPWILLLLSGLGSSA